LYACVAQLVEHSTDTRKVPGSTPGTRTLMDHLRKALTWIMILGLCSIVIFALLPFLLRSTYENNDDVESKQELASVIESKKVSSHVETPESVRAIYMTSCVASTPRLRQSLKKLIEETELNAVVIDIKDSSGTITFKDPSIQPNVGLMGGCKVGDLKEFIESLHASGIYVIGRISVFQDLYYTSHNPDYAVKKASTGETWKDYKGLAFVDVGAKEYWKYIVRLSRASYDLGFDELNFDYVRYPSDGNMKDTRYIWTNSTVVLASTQGASTTQSTVRAISKAEMLKSFFEFLHSELKDSGAKLSVDLFGLTTTVNNDMNIGQVLEYALPYFDYISPMVYPSHYPPGWSGLAKPAEKPYEVIKISMQGAVNRERSWREANGHATSSPSKMRPWLQDFNLGATYTPEMVRAQMQAGYDIGLSSWMLWNASNRYTAAALLPE
jgi:hypothetical protein